MRLPNEKSYCQRTTEGILAAGKMRVGDESAWRELLCRVRGNLAKPGMRIGHWQSIERHSPHAALSHRRHRPSQAHQIHRAAYKAIQTLLLLVPPDTLS